MKTKISLAALAVACVTSGQATAAITGTELTNLAGLDPDFTWADANTWGGLDTPAPTFGTVDPWVTTSASAPCDWKGIACTGGSVTHVEIPNAGVAAPIADILAMLAPDAATIKVINVSTGGTPAPSNPQKNNLTGPATGLESFTALTHLAVNGTGISGVIPDLRMAPNLKFVNIEENGGITGIAGDLGGAALQKLYIKNSTPVQMTGDLTATLEASKNSLVILDIQGSGLAGMTPDYSGNNAVTGTDMRFQINGSKLYGTYSITNPGTDPDTGLSVVNIGGTGVITSTPNTDDTSIGYVAATAVQPAAGITAMAGTADGALVVTPTAATGGSADTYLVSYSSDAGATFSTPAVSLAAGASHTFEGLADGNYIARVQAQNSTTGVMSITVDSDSVTLAATTDPGTTPPTCTPPKELNEAQTECVDPAPTTPTEPTPVKSGGGGAALWLALFPLMGLLRRKRA